jgi:hypothetical protein
MVDIREEEHGVGGYDPDAGYPNGDTPDEEPITWETLWNAPDYAQLVAMRQSRKAKEYTGKVNSVLKSLTFASIQAGHFPDAAALLHYGPPWSHAVGQLADSDRRVAMAVDMVTSPNSPLVMFAVTTIALAGQIARNHESQLKEIPNARKRASAIRKTRKQTEKESPPRFTLRVLRWQIPIRMRTPKLGAMFAGFRAQTQAPELLTVQVFSDPKLIAALEKQGIKVTQADA